MKKTLFLIALLSLICQGALVAEVLKITEVKIALVVDPARSSSYCILLQANIPPLPAETFSDGMAQTLNIDHAVIKLTGTVVQLPLDPPYLEAILLTSSWNPANVSWDITNRVDERYRSSDVFLLSAKGPTEFRLDVTELVRGWIVAGMANNGLALRNLPDNLPSLLNSSVVTFDPAAMKVALLIYYTYNPK
ncbi:MAG: hypothetical protein ONB27_05855 [candidate division KSB1 bacterium]|nr:hypothetical protein [candidate division KSB1 bacterium]